MSKISEAIKWAHFEREHGEGADWRCVISILEGVQVEYEALADLVPELVEALELAVSVARLPGERDTQDLLNKLSGSGMKQIEIANIASDLEYVYDTLTKARELQGDGDDETR